VAVLALEHVEAGLQLKPGVTVVSEAGEVQLGEENRGSPGVGGVWDAGRLAMA
jgi:hypothetical protein